MAVRLCSGVLPKPIPGSRTIRSPAMPARAAISSDRAKKARCRPGCRSRIGALAIMHDNDRNSMVGDHVRHIGIALQTPDVIDDRGAGRKRPALRPLPSWCRSTPARQARRPPAAPAASRRISSSNGTASASPYGRVDSAPTSRMSAPSATMRRACSIAASGSRKRPPSEKESGVTFRTPITSGRPSARSRSNRSGETLVRRSDRGRAAGKRHDVALRRLAGSVSSAAASGTRGGTSQR